MIQSTMFIKRASVPIKYRPVSQQTGAPKPAARVYNKKAALARVKHMQRKKDKGICVQAGCHSRAKAEHTLCIEHLEIKRNTSKQKRHQSRLNGVCTSCHKEQATPEFRTCAACRNSRRSIV